MVRYHDERLPLLMVIKFSESDSGVINTEGTDYARVVSGRWLEKDVNSYIANGGKLRDAGNPAFMFPLIVGFAFAFLIGMRLMKKSVFKNNNEKHSGTTVWMVGTIFHGIALFLTVLSLLVEDDYTSRNNALQNGERYATFIAGQLLTSGFIGSWFWFVVGMIGALMWCSGEKRSKAERSKADVGVVGVMAVPAPMYGAMNAPQPVPQPMMAQPAPAMPQVDPRMSGQQGMYTNPHIQQQAPMAPMAPQAPVQQAPPQNFHY